MMHKLLKMLVLIAILASPVISSADENNMMNRYDLTEQFTNTTIPLSGSEYAVIDFGDNRMRGFISLEVTITGSGTLRIYHESSNTGTNYSTAIVNGTGASDVVTALTAGTAFYQFNAPFGDKCKIWFVETGSANSITVTTAMAIVQ